MNPWAAFIIGIFLGFLLGFLALGLLVGPRLAELDATVQSLRELLKYSLEAEDEN